MNDSAEWRRMTVEIISKSISTKVWDRAGIELATPVSAVRFAPVARHSTDCATRPGPRMDAQAELDLLCSHTPKVFACYIAALVRCC